ncbi:MAG: hypothetical protein JWO31_1830 [Phycisphaerales bacterium]|nr:hypothetical protein [Phycisphaerales bacterium]
MSVPSDAASRNPSRILVDVDLDRLRARLGLPGQPVTDAGAAEWLERTGYERLGRLWTLNAATVVGLEPGEHRGAWVLRPHSGRPGSLGRGPGSGGS